MEGKLTEIVSLQQFLKSDPLKAIIWALFITTFGWFPVWGQGAPNPFDLSPRLSLPEADRDAARAAWDTGNPFDVAHALAPVTPGLVQPPARLRPARPTRSPQEQYQTFIFAVIMGILALLTILFTLFRTVYRRAWRGFFNENMLNQVFRESQNAGVLPYLILYAMFLLNAGTFVFLTARHFGGEFPAGLWQSWAWSVAGVSALVTAKHIVLAYLGSVFPVEKETGSYSFTMVVFGILLGILLVASNVFIAYGPSEYTRWAVFATFGIIGLVYVFRSLRGLVIANNFLTSHKFHFFLYLCTVEIAPVLVLVKLIQDQGLAIR